MNARTGSHKKQHVVPRCYLAAWQDPVTPEGQDPFVWRWDRVGTNPRRKAPTNLFTQTDMYTVMRGGERLLHLEDGLKELEDHFARIRRTVIEAGQAVTVEDKVFLSAFMAAMFVRTRRQKAHHQKQFERILGAMRQIEARARADPDRHRRPFPPSPDQGTAIEIEEIRSIADQPLDVVIPASIEVLTPLWARLNVAFLKAPDYIHFITSDNPVYMLDPTVRTGSMFRIAPGAPTVQVTMPVSPSICMFLARDARSGFLKVPRDFVQRVNQRLRVRCDEHYVSTSGEVNGDLFPPLPELGGRVG